MAISTQFVAAGHIRKCIKKGHLHHCVQVAFMEAAGIEPASRGISAQASTCVVDYLSFTHLSSYRRDLRRTIPELCLAASVLDMTRGDPELQPTFGTLRRSPAAGDAYARRPLRGFPRQIKYVISF